MVEENIPSENPKPTCCQQVQNCVFCLLMFDVEILPLLVQLA